MQYCNFANGRVITVLPMSSVPQYNILAPAPFTAVCDDTVQPGWAVAQNPDGSYTFSAPALDLLKNDKSRVFQRQIAAIEATQHRSVRESALALVGGTAVSVATRTRLQTTEAAIQALRVKIEAVNAATTVDELNAVT